MSENGGIHVPAINEISWKSLLADPAKHWYLGD